MAVALASPRDATGDEPDVVRLVDGDAAAGEDEVGGQPGAQPPQRQLRPAAAGYQADGDLGQAEHRVLVRNDDVAAHRELAAAAERVAVHGGHRGLGQVSHPAERRAEHLALPQDLRVGHGVAFLEIRARAERLRPRGAEHDRPDAGVAARSAQAAAMDSAIAVFSALSASGRSSTISATWSTPVSLRTVMPS